MWTAMSPADHADYAEGMQQAALFRRQKTVSANESAKADAADNAEKDSYHIVETKLFMFIQQICEGTRSFLPCYFLVFPSFIPYVFNGRSHGNVVQARAETSSLLECYAESSRHSWNKIQKLKKYLASKSKAKLAWALPSAARYSLSKNSLELIAWVSKTLTRNAPKGAKKKLQEIPLRNSLE